MVEDVSPIAQDGEEKGCSQAVAEVGGETYPRGKSRVIVAGLFLPNENTVGPAVDPLALVLREA